MKIVCVRNNYITSAADAAQPVLYIRPDSAMVRSGRPFFVPDFANRFIAEPQIVVRLDRMGKGIDPRFAPRYVGAVTMGIAFTAQEPLQPAMDSWALCWEGACFDGAAFLGDWIEMPELTAMAGGSANDVILNSLTFGLTVDSRSVVEGSTCHLHHSIATLIAAMSRYNTIKTGDLLYTGAPDPSPAIACGQTLEGFVMGRKVLTVRIK